MKPLHEYETPITDARFEYHASPQNDVFDRLYLMRDEARLLEKKLAACREALAFYAGRFPNDDLGNWQERVCEDEGDIARETLTKTK